MIRRTTRSGGLCMSLSFTELTQQDTAPVKRALVRPLFCDGLEATFHRKLINRRWKDTMSIYSKLSLLCEAQFANRRFAATVA
jgi:hypothetical protein